MRELLRHTVRWVSAFLLVWLPTACGTEAGPEEGAAAGDGTVMLVLNTGLIGSPHAGEAGWPEHEKMKTLRIVVLHPQGTVEYNQCVDFGQNLQTEYRRQLIRVKQNEKKTIYLIANETSITDLKEELDAFHEGSGGFKEKLDEIIFAPDGDSPLPMSAAYELEVKEESQECQFYLVRAATKFTFRFRNFRDGAVRVNSISVSDIAGTMYLMAHKQNRTMSFWEADGSEGELFWIDWLKRVSDESQANPDDKDLADRRGWITDYDIPPTTSGDVTQHAPQNFRVPASTTDQGVPEPGTAVFPVFYLPESKHLRQPDGGAYGEQAYAMTLDLTDDRNEHKTFSFPFDNLKALFRNTNVVVDVTIYQKKIVVQLVPYAEVELEPDFGLDSPESHYIPIYGDDYITVICYYDEKTGRYYIKNENGDYVETVNPFYDTEAGTGWRIIRDDAGNPLYYWDPKTGQYYDAGRNPIDPPSL